MTEKFLVRAFLLLCLGIPLIGLPLAFYFELPCCR